MTSQCTDTQSTVENLLSLERLGATIYPLAIDISHPSAATNLRSALATLNLPPVAGVVHAAGVLCDQLVEQITPEAFKAVLAPKIAGALALHTVFPPNSPNLDFFVLFSSCGQLLGFPGQASRGMGMGASSNGALEAELYARGITDVTPDEAFKAWSSISSIAEADHGVVLRARLLRESGEPLPHAILKDIFGWKKTSVNEGEAGKIEEKKKVTGQELMEHLRVVVKKCVSKKLSIVEEIDETVALSEMGMDSVMTVHFRMSLQQALAVGVGPTLLWKYQTVRHLVEHLYQALDKSPLLRT